MLKRILTFVCIVSVPFTTLAANDSSKIHIPSAAEYKTQKYQSYVDTNDWITLPSSPYVIAAGNGGTNMNLTCPTDRPVMYQWTQHLGFAGFIYVSSGGGNSTVRCCAVAHKWTA